MVAEQQLSRSTSGSERVIAPEEGELRGSGQTFAPEYRMPPLYGEEKSLSQTQQAANLQTHSNKFPIEREVVLSSGDKNSKIPILHEYKQRTAGRVAIAPDAPIKQQAWIQEGTHMHEVRQDGQSRQYQESYSKSSSPYAMSLMYGPFRCSIHTRIPSAVLRANMRLPVIAISPEPSVCRGEALWTPACKICRPTRYEHNP